MTKFANYQNPVHFYNHRCINVAKNCNATITTTYTGFSVSHPSYDGVKEFENVDVLYAFLVGLSIGYNSQTKPEQLLCG